VSEAKLKYDAAIAAIVTLEKQANDDIAACNQKRREVEPRVEALQKLLSELKASYCIALVKGNGADIKARIDAVELELSTLDQALRGCNELSLRCMGDKRNSDEKKAQVLRRYHRERFDELVPGYNALIDSIVPQINEINKVAGDAGKLGFEMGLPENLFKFDAVRGMVLAWSKSTGIKK
jgi:hypothetical protein